MKTIPPPCPVPETGPKYWRSLEDLAETPEFRRWLEREFPAGASEWTDPISRRHFVRIMSASFLLAGIGLTGCRRPVEKIMPFSKMPEGYTHGVPQFYATAMPVRGSAIPLLAKAYDGRPIKIEGNPEHPDSNGGTDLFAQASILNLYDPDRAMRFTRDGSNAEPETALAFLEQLSGAARQNGGRGLSFLLERSSSPSRARLVALLRERLPNAGWYAFEPVDFDVHRQAAAAAFGRPVAPYLRLDEASVILSLDCDFIGGEEDAYLHIRRFANRRRLKSAEDSMSRLYSVEGLYTLTGANADHRLRIASSAVQGLAARMALEIFKQKGVAAGPLQGALDRLAAGFAGHDQWIVECARDLANTTGPGRAAGDAVVVAGYRQPLAVHLIAQALNAALGSVGKAVVFHEAPEPALGSLAELVRGLEGGQVQTLVILGGNPAYTAPADLSWDQAAARASTVVRLGYYEDESFVTRGWHLPQAHYLESWGDARTADGTIVPIQPLIQPLFGGLTELEVLARLAGTAAPGPYQIVRETFRGLAGTDENTWRKFLHDGFLEGSARPGVSVQFNAGAVARALETAAPLAAPGRDRFEVNFYRDYRVDDGRYNNNGWLQELPDPITKMTWENVILLSARTARELNLDIRDQENNRLLVPWIKVSLAGRSIEGPAWIQPGQADHTIGLALGYGRRKTGRVGSGAGYDAYRLWTGAYFAAGAKIEATGRRHLLATTQNHWAMEGRPIVREANLADYRKHPGFARSMDMPEPAGAASAYPNPLDQAGATAVHHWGMSIDLNACVGCSACMAACQSENNVPIVGKDQVTRNREMHWLRIDRYYAGPVEDPQVVNQPMLCQHCEAAPCESVCPVNATVHDEEGLNVMVYNRCVGTRYCSNNCPYKVRRFNYFDYHKRPLDELYKNPLLSRTRGQWEVTRFLRDPDKGSRAEDEWELAKLLKNPDVTVRMRGVMEKCTFCIQRLEQAKIAQKVKAGASGNIEVPDGTIKTACQQACPAEAIVFGNIKDPNSQVSKLKRLDRDYTVLEFLATKPRLTYLARVRNPNPSIPDLYKDMPGSLKEYSEQGGNPLGGVAGHGQQGHERPGVTAPAKGGH